MASLAGRPAAVKAPAAKAPLVPYGKPAPSASKPAPKPYVAPPTNVHTANNPRGAPIVTKAPIPKFLTTANNPRGAPIVKQVYIQPGTIRAPKAAAPHETSVPGYLAGRAGALVGNPIAAIAAHEVTHIPSIGLNFLKDVRDFVPTTIEGIDTIAQAGAHDLMGVASGATHVGPGAVAQPEVQHSQLAALAEAAWKNSLTHDAVTGNFSGALHKLVNHPLYGALEFAGGVGAVGRVLGAAGRVGVLGEHVADAAELARDDRPLAPGTPGLKRHGSPNLIVRVAQRAADKATLPDALERRIVAHHIRKNVNDIYGIQGAMASRHAETVIEEQHAAAAGEKGTIESRIPAIRHRIPADRKAAADVAYAQIAGAASRHSVLEDMGHLRDTIRDHLATTKMTKVAEKAATANADNLDHFLSDPNVAAVDAISQSFLARAAQQEAEKGELGLLTKKQAETAPLHGAVAMGHVPGNDVRIAAAEDKLPSVRAAKYLTAKREVAAAKRAVKEADPTELATAKDNLVDAKADLKDVAKYKGEKLQGVVENVGGTIRGKPIVRRVPAAEIRRRLLSVGRDPADMGYVNMTAPVDKDGREAQQAARGLTRSDSAYHSRTAQGLPAGNTRPGAAMLLDSQLQSQRAIDRARGFDFLTQQTAVHGDDGKLLKADKYGIQKLKENYEAEHGIPTTVVPLRSAGSVNRMDDFVSSGGDYQITGDTKGVTKKERFGLMPTVAANHYLKHLNADNVGNGAFGAVNRAFRNTVLPLSPKWIAGNDIEGFIRSGLVGAGPRDAQLVGKVTDIMRARGDHQAADTVDAIMNGQHYSMANRRNHESLVQGSLEHPDKQLLLRNRPVIKQLADVYMHGIVEPVFAFNKKVESGFDRAVLGAHMHSQMLQFGANVYQAAAHEQQWLEKLADGYSDPAMVMSAGRFIQKTLGQYSRFGPLAKRVVNTWMPFSPWYANALRFVYITMPANHPIVQSILLAAGQTVQKEYASQFASQGNLNQKFGGHRFGSLGTSLALKGGGLTDLSRYMPWGAPSGGPLAMATAPIGPQVQGPALAVFSGEDPFGSPLKDKNGDVTDQAQQLIVGLNEFALSLTGPLDLATRIGLNQGSTPYSADTLFTPLADRTKPNSHRGGPGILGGIERSLIPGYPTYLNSATTGGTSGVGGYTGGAAATGYTGGAGSTGYTGGSASKGYTGASK